MLRNKALLVGVEQFAALRADAEELSLTDVVRPPLDFVNEVVPEVERAFVDLGYDTTVLREPERPELVLAVSGVLDSDDSGIIVHVVSHGEMGDDDNRLDVVPACGRTGLGTNVSDWVSTAQQRNNPALFLLDLCRAGKAARLPWLTALGGHDARVWVIAGAGPDEDAFDGRFSTAVAAVLAQLAKDGLGTDPSRRYVSFQTVARRIAERVEAMPGLPQRVHATPIDPAQRVAELPFFPNPRYSDDPQREARQAIESPLRSFLDELDDVLDSEHFLGRVGSHFAGRRKQLRVLARWMDGGFPTSGLRVVVGSPGVGKSALLGALVCSAHPVLADAVPHVRARLGASGCPSRNDHLGAVHARQRRAEELIASLARQFAFSKTGDGWTVLDLIREFKALPTTPVVVVDAVDEALHPQQVMSELLFPLAAATRMDDTPVCRLLVGLRPWDQFATLSDLAVRDGELLDLDEVTPAEVRADIEDYLNARLADLPRYAAAAQRPVRERLAATMAKRLVRRRSHPSGPEWGAFLVAGMFAGYLNGIAPATTAEEAERLGETVPRTLPEVLELDLGVHQFGEKLRATLAALAHAKGEGMPAEVAGLVAAGFADGMRAEDVVNCLDAGRFYLRTTVERDGTTLYRLLHQSLADYLRRFPTVRPAHDVDASYSSAPAQASLVLDRILSAVRGGEWGRWSSVPPYLVRHTIHHAVEAGRVDELLVDVEFLVHADSASLRPELRRATGTAARVNADVYERAWAARPHGGQYSDLADRRWVLAVEAARHGEPVLAERFVADTGPEGWAPRWAATVSPDGGWTTAVACGVVDDRRFIAVAGSTGAVRIRDAASGDPIGEPLTGHRGHVSAVATTDLAGRQVVVTGGADTTVRVSDVASGDLVTAFEAGCGWINAIACVRLRGRAVAVVCGDESVRLWDLASAEPVGGPQDGHRWARAVACVDPDGHPVVVTGSNDHGVRIWDVDGGMLLHPPMRGHRDRVYAASCGVLGGRTIAITGGDDDAVHVWDIATGRPVDRPLVGHTSWVSAVACTAVDGRPVAFSGGFDRTVRMWDLATATCRAVLVMPVEVHAVSVSPDGGLVVCSGPDVLVFDRLATRDHSSGTNGVTT